MTLSSRINHRIRQRGVERGPESIFAVVLDGEQAHCFTESHLDTWWNSLTPEGKAEVYERELGDEQEVCRMCGCTNGRPCMNPGPCFWLDPHHTVCSAPACAEKYRSELFDEVFGGPTPLTVTNGGRTGVFVASSQLSPAVLLDERLSPFGREQIDYFLRTGQWLSVGELDQAKTWDNPQHPEEDHFATL